LKKVFFKILGHPDKYPLNHRIANAVILIGIFLGIQSSIFNYVLNLPIVTVYATLGTSCILIFSYYFSRILGKFYFPVYLSVLTSLIIYTPVMWIGNGGSAGGFQYYIFIYSTFVIAVIENKRNMFLILLLTLTISILLLLYEYHFPENIFKYPSSEDKLFDLIISFSSVLIGVSALFYVYTKEYTKTNNKIIEKNEQLLKHNIEVERQRNKIENQRKKLELQNFHINEGIGYAHKIQKAALPKYEILKRNTLDSFILYLPKEKISGDFYYFVKRNNKLVIMVADSTGHGIPGGFMSMLGLTMAEEIIKRNEIQDAASALNLFRDKVISALDQQRIKSVTNDGFDVAICVIDQLKNKINYAGANIPLVIIRDQKTLFIEPDNMPVGSYINDIPFKNQFINIEKGDAMYLYTDGIIDQFGGDKLQKFSFKRLENILLDISSEEFSVQKEKIKKEHRLWKGYRKRTDDALIIGFKIY